MFALTVKARPSTTLNEYQRNLKPVPQGMGPKWATNGPTRLIMFRHV